MLSVSPLGKQQAYLGEIRIQHQIFTLIPSKLNKKAIHTFLSSCQVSTHVYKERQSICNLRKKTIGQNETKCIFTNWMSRFSPEVNYH